jgi:hypothetical protein
VIEATYPDRLNFIIQNVRVGLKLPRAMLQLWVRCVSLEFAELRYAGRAQISANQAYTAALNIALMRCRRHVRTGGRPDNICSRSFAYPRNRSGITYCRTNVHHTPKKKTMRFEDPDS